MSNSFIFTRGGLSVIIDNTPYSTESSHPNYDQIINALRAREWNKIPDLINVSKAVEQYVADNKATGNVRVDAEHGIVFYKEEAMHNTVTEQILSMMRDNFPIEPLCKFLDRLMLNPSKKTVDELYRWMAINGMTVDEEGYLIAYKRVQADFTSFHDSKTMNAVGTYVEMSRNAVDDRSENTCSTGLHFCSQAYLPHYCGGSGQVLLLQIDPADVVSIPTDYNSSKGRACCYFVLKALEGDARVNIETEDVLPQPVMMDTADVNKSDTYKSAYAIGYKDGRGKQKKVVKERYEYDSVDDEYDDSHKDLKDDADGYIDGYADGRAKKPKLY